MDHHYLPQFLGRGWVGALPDGQIQTFRLDLPDVYSKRWAPSAVGHEPDLFALSLDRPGLNKHRLETDFFQTIDDNAAPVRTKMMAGDIASLSDSERIDWARFLMSLRLRQPSTLRALCNFATSVLKSRLNTGPPDYSAERYPGCPPTYLEFAEQNFPGLKDDIGKLLYERFVDHEVVGNRLLQLMWGVRDFSSGTNRLLIADDPCIFEGGLDDSSLIVALPLGPEVCFFAAGSSSALAYTRDRGNSETIDRLNAASILRANKFVYGYDETELAFIRANKALREQYRQVDDLEERLSAALHAKAMDRKI